jgi:hypothetical protein
MAIAVDGCVLKVVVSCKSNIDDHLATISYVGSGDRFYLLLVPPHTTTSTRSTRRSWRQGSAHYY